MRLILSKINNFFILNEKKPLLAWIIILWVTIVFGFYIFYNIPRILVRFDKFKELVF